MAKPRLRKVSETHVTVTFQHGERVFTVAKKMVKPSTLAAIPGYADGGEIDFAPDEAGAMDWDANRQAAYDAANAAKEGLTNPRNWITTPLNALMPTFQAGSPWAKGMAYVNSHLPGGKSYDQEQAAYDESAPKSALGATANLGAAALPLGKMAGAALGVGAKVAKDLVKGRKVARAVEAIGQGVRSADGAIHLTPGFEHKLSGEVFRTPGYHDYDKLLEQAKLPAGDYDLAERSFNDGFIDQYGKFYDRSTAGRRVTGASHTLDSSEVPEAGVKALSSGKRSGALANIDWDHMTPGQMVDFAEQGGHLVQDKTGQFIGAPRGIDSPKKLQAMRDMVDGAVDKGSFGADWYRRSKAAILDVTGGDEVRASQLAKQLAIYSPQSEQRPNLGMAVKAWNQNALGGPDLVESNYDRPRTGAAAAASGAAFRDPSSTKGLGPKTGNYERQLDPRTANEMVTRAVNDLWVGRTYGYKPVEGVEKFDRGFTAQEHSFLTGEQALAAARAQRRGAIPGDLRGMPPVQASMWVGERLDEIKVKHPEWPLEKQKAWANESPSEALHGDPHLGSQREGQGLYSAHETTEATPGSASGHLGNVANNDDMKAAYAADPRSNYLDQNGRDMMYSSSGMLQTPGTHGMGEWQNPDTGVVEHNPNLALHPLVGYEKGHSPSLVGAASRNHPVEPVLDPASRLLVEKTNDWRSLLDAQSQGAYHTPFGGGRLSTLPWSHGEGTATRAVMEGGPGREAPNVPASSFQPTPQSMLRKWDSDPGLLQRVGGHNDLDRQMAAQGGGEVNQSLMHLRDIVASQGFTGLAEHIQKYGYAGLPVFVVGSLEALRAANSPSEDK